MSAVCFVFLFGVTASASSSQYEPFSSTVYDLGPIDKCVRVPLELCYTVYGLSNDTIIPQEAALTMAQMQKQYIYSKNNYYIPNDCDNYLYSVLCFGFSQPVCLGNDLVKFTEHSASIFENMMNLISCLFAKKFENKKDVLEMQLALFKKSVFGPARKKTTFSLKNCTKLDMPLCAKNPHGSTVPEYMAEGLEIMYKRTPMIEPFWVWCKNATYRLLCTYPTCTSDGRLQGYLTKDQCVEAYMQCVPELTKKYKYTKYVFGAVCQFLARGH